MRWLFLVLSVFILVSCGPETESSDNSAKYDNPLYSDSELEELQNADGREAETLTSEILVELFSEDNLTVFHISNQFSGEYFRELESLEEDSGDGFLLIHILVPQEKSKGKVNLFLRKNNLSSKAFLLSDAKILKERIGSWKGEFPLFLFRNPQDELELLYEQDLSVEEFKTILQSVTL